MSEIKWRAEKKYEHTYLVYRKMLAFEGEIPLSREILSSPQSINSKLKEVIIEAYDKSKVISTFDYGLYGSGADTVLKELPYMNYKLVFAEDPFSIVLVNFFKDGEKYPSNETVCLEAMNFIGKDDCLGKIYFDQFSFKFLNTHIPFCDFASDHISNERLSINHNDVFWRDVNHYIQFEKSKGIYELIQLNSLVIVTGYRPIESGILSFNHGIINPYKINSLKS
ncbi:hypothetical protein H1D32_21065 [Anaerobacillus sp. CMMVII]|uniref:hypothetical protein n=1 Tax=Anaerobacillus sp. CMMVII TaxID=2755588 RepID=UPI0021B7DB0B|nr:hypothetical protein [Anaerobacillus sp. CMMVII]MCT8139970.1 hypothetical protein [Anaerobacillus sp. CMMVII]